LEAAIYADRAFDRQPFLADTVVNAGCVAAARSSGGLP
jgi:hypothetical protein